MLDALTDSQHRRRAAAVAVIVLLLGAGLAAWYAPGGGPTPGPGPAPTPTPEPPGDALRLDASMTGYVLLLDHTRSAAVDMQNVTVTVAANTTAQREARVSNRVRFGGAARQHGRVVAAADLPSPRTWESDETAAVLLNATAAAEPGTTVTVTVTNTRTGAVLAQRAVTVGHYEITAADIPRTTYDITYREYAFRVVDEDGRPAWYIGVDASFPGPGADFNATNIYRTPAEQRGIQAVLRYARHDTVPQRELQVALVLGSDPEPSRVETMRIHASPFALNSSDAAPLDAATAPGATLTRRVNVTNYPEVFTTGRADRVDGDVAEVGRLENTGPLRVTIRGVTELDTAATAANRTLYIHPGDGAEIFVEVNESRGVQPRDGWANINHAVRITGRGGIPLDNPAQLPPGERASIYIYGVGDATGEFTVAELDRVVTGVHAEMVGGPSWREVLRDDDDGDTSTSNSTA